MYCLARLGHEITNKARIDRLRLEIGFLRDNRLEDTGRLIEWIRICTLCFSWFASVYRQRCPTADSTVTSKARPDCQANDLTTPPLQIDYFKAAASPQPADSSILPLVRQSRQDMDCPIMTLQQHFGNTGGKTKIAVNLEGWTGIKEIRIDPAVFRISIVK